MRQTITCIDSSSGYKMHLLPPLGPWRRNPKRIPCFSRSSCIAREWGVVLPCGYCARCYDGETTLCTRPGMLRNVQVFQRGSFRRVYQKRTGCLHSQFLVCPSSLNTTSLVLTAPGDQFETKPFLQSLSPLYDLTPAEAISAVVTEVGLIPPSSVPTVLFRAGVQE